MRKKGNICKKAIACMIAMVGVSMCISGCGKGKEAPQSTQTNTESLEAGAENITTGESATSSDGKGLTAKDCVKDAYEVNFTLEDGTEYACELEYHVPEIILDCEGAKTLNEQIQSDCEDAKLVEGDTEYDYYPQWREISYEAYVNGDYLSVVLLKESLSADYQLYQTYNLNIATGEIATREELAQYAGIKERDITKALRKAAIYEADQLTLACMEEPYFQNEENAGHKQEVFLENLVARFHTMEESNLELERIPMFLSKEGELRAVVSIHTLAGAGISNRPLTLQTNTANKDFSVSMEEAVFLSYSDGKMSVRIEENDWTRSAFSNSYIEFGKEYPVAGVFKDYIQGEMLGLMNGDYMIPVFVSDDHTIAYLDIYECAQGGSFCLTEMAYAPYSVEEITEENAQAIAEDLSHYIFERYDGFSQRALDLYEGEVCGLEGTLALEDGTEALFAQYLCFDMEDTSILYFQESVERGDSTMYEGRCTYMGMDEKGMLFTYYLENFDSGLGLHGMFQTARKFEWDDALGDFKVYMNYTGISGDELFSGEQETVELSFSMG